MVKTYKVDLDYEAALFDPNYKEDSPGSQKVIREFEYIFFLIEKDPSILKNIKGYDPIYLEDLKHLGFVIPELNPKATEYEFWWGHHHDPEIEKKLNSKLTSAQLALENHWGFSEGAIVENLSELKAHIEKFPAREKWIIKRPYSFSGIGHVQFKRNDLNIESLEKALTEKVLLEPVFERIFDIGTTFEISNGIIQRQFMVENFNTSVGGFRGGAGASDLAKFKKYIFEKFSYSLEGLEKITLEISQKYLAMGATSNIQIDSFIYKDQGELKIYPLVEVNYRKTMGLVIQAIADKFMEADFIEWRVETLKSIKDSPLDENWVQLSPHGNHFRSYFSKSSKKNAESSALPERLDF